MKNHWTENQAGFALSFSSYWHLIVILQFLTSDEPGHKNDTDVISKNSWGTLISEIQQWVSV